MDWKCAKIMLNMKSESTEKTSDKNSSRRKIQNKGIALNRRFYEQVFHVDREKNTESLVVKKGLK